MNNNSHTADQASAAVTSARRFAALVEAAIADLEERVPSGMAPLEQALAQRIRAALARLLGCVDQLAADGLVVLGSTAQPRPNPMLKVEHELRREIGGSLEKLVLRAESGAMMAQANALTRKSREERS